MDVPFVFLLNAGSGKQDVASVQALLERLIPANRQGCFYVVRPGEDFLQTLEQAVEDCRKQQGILVAAGGDGTVNAVISRALPLNMTLGVIPLGTFNYFARMHGIPVDVEEAIQGLLDATPVELPVCKLNGEPFIVNVSLGLHAKIIAAREKHTRITGRNRFVAFLSGVITLLREQYTMRARLTLDGRKLQRKATTVMISHNRFHLEALHLEQAERELDGRFAVVVVHPLSRRALLSLIWKRLLGQVEQADELELMWARELDVQLMRSYARVVVDGELKRMRTPLKICMQDAAIRCLVPAKQEEQV